MHATLGIARVQRKAPILDHPNASVPPLSQNLRDFPFKQTQKPLYGCFLR